MLEIVAVVIIVALVLALTVRAFYRELSGKGGCCKGGCPANGPRGRRSGCRH